jgi:integrase
MATRKSNVWIATGHGSYRVIRPGICELRWLPSGRRGPRLSKTVECSPSEARDYLLREAARRGRAELGLPTRLSWQESIALYRAHMQAKGRVDLYVDNVISTLEAMQELAKTPEGVSPALIQTWLDTYAKCLRKRGLKGWGNTANHRRNMVSGFFRYLYRMRHIRENPITFTTPYPVAEHPARNLRPEEYARIWTVSEPSVRDLMDWCLLSACRLGEMAKMKFDHIQGDRWVCTGRKAHDSFVLPLSAELIAIVERQKRLPDGLVFHKWVHRRPDRGSGHGFLPGSPIEKRWWEEVIAHRCDLAKIPPCTPHDIRHAGATWAREAGVSPWHIQSLLGHSTVKTTEIYARESESGRKTASEALSRIRAAALNVDEKLTKTEAVKAPQNKAQTE